MSRPSPLIAGLLERCRAAGLELHTGSGGLTYDGPATPVVAALLRELGRFRTDVLEALRPAGRPPRCPRHYVLLSAGGIRPRCDPQAAGVATPDWAMPGGRGDRADDARERHRPRRRAA